MSPSEGLGNGPIMSPNMTLIRPMQDWKSMTRTSRLFHRPRSDRLLPILAGACVLVIPQGLPDCGTRQSQRGCDGSGAGCARPRNLRRRP